MTPDAFAIRSPYPAEVPPNGIVTGALQPPARSSAGGGSSRSPHALANLRSRRVPQAAYTVVKPIGLGCCQAFTGEERETFNIICMKVQEALNRVSAIKKAGYIARQTGPIQFW